MTGPHNPKLVHRALKRLTRFTNREAFTKQIPLVKGLIIVNLIVQWLLLATHRDLKDQLLTQIWFCAIYLPMGLAWVVDQLSRHHLITQSDIWYVSADGRVRSANYNAFNAFERRRLFRFTRETRVTLPSGKSLFLFKDEPTAETVQEAVDLLVRLESATDYVDRHSVTGPYRRVRIEDAAPFRVSTEPPPIELVSAEEHAAATNHVQSRKENKL